MFLSIHKNHNGNFCYFFTEDWFDLLFGVHNHNLFLCAEIFFQKFQIRKFLPLFPFKSLPLSTTNLHISNCYQWSENLINLSHLFQVTFNFTWMNKYTLKMQNVLHFTNYFPFYG